MVQYYLAGDYTLQSGETIKDCRLAYETYGSLNAAADNAIVYPTWYSGFISDNEWLIGAGRGLDPARYFIIVPCLLGNGQSSSPSNNPTFSNATLYDNVVLQHRLVTEHLRVKKVKLVTGWSMGAQQTYQWACLYPELVERAVPFAGSARTSPHNFVFLEGIKNAIRDENGNPSDSRIRAFARVYAGWGFTQAFYKRELWRTLKKTTKYDNMSLKQREQMGVEHLDCSSEYNSLEDFLTNFWEHFFLQRDARNLDALIWTWQHGDISANPVFEGNLSKALCSIRAKTIILAPENDLYFPKEDNRTEVKDMLHSSLKVIPGDWGHFAGGGLCPEDTNFIDSYIKEVLAFNL